MSWYGNKKDNYLTRDIIQCVLDKLPEIHWYKLKLNTKLVRVIRKSRKQFQILDLATQGQIESLDTSIMSAISSQKVDVAKVIHYLYGSVLISTGNKRDKLYYFLAPTWIADDGQIIKNLIQTELIVLYERLRYGLAQNINLVEPKTFLLNEKLINKLGKLLSQLKKPQFPSAVTTLYLQMYKNSSYQSALNKPSLTF